MMRLERRITKSYFNLAIKQYAPLVQKLAFRVGINETQIEEMKNRALEELIKCMICYKCSGSFITFFYGRLLNIFRHMRDVEKRANRLQNVSIDLARNVIRDSRDIDSEMVFQECLACLNEEECAVITSIYFGEQTIREVSDANGGVVSTIYYIKKRAIDKMKRKYEVESE